MFEIEKDSDGFGGECRIYVEADQMGTYKITRVEVSAMGCDPIRTFYEEVPEEKILTMLDDLKGHPSSEGRELGIKYYTDVIVQSPEGLVV